MEIKARKAGKARKGSKAGSGQLAVALLSAVVGGSPLQEQIKFFPYALSLKPCASLYFDS